jgi:hypothetical protein
MTKQHPQPRRAELRFVFCMLAVACLSCGAGDITPPSDPSEWVVGELYQGKPGDLIGESGYFLWLTIDSNGSWEMGLRTECTLEYSPYWSGTWTELRDGVISLAPLDGDWPGSTPVDEVRIHRGTTCDLLTVEVFGADGDVNNLVFSRGVACLDNCGNSEREIYLCEDLCQ